MIVYVVMMPDWEWNEVVSVHASVEGADKWIAKQRKPKGTYEIEQWTVEP